jgi:hypothetical protein
MYLHYPKLQETLRALAHALCRFTGSTSSARRTRNGRRADAWGVPGSEGVRLRGTLRPGYSPGAEEVLGPCLGPS